MMYYMISTECVNVHLFFIFFIMLKKINYKETKHPFWGRSFSYEKQSSWKCVVHICIHYTARENRERVTACSQRGLIYNGECLPDMSV